MAVTVPAASRSSASTVTVAAWPSEIEARSDSTTSAVTWRPALSMTTAVPAGAAYPATTSQLGDDAIDR